jgi:hypothetical protein
MKLQRLLALSSSAVIAAACSSGGSAIAPHPAPSTAGSAPTSTKHVANAKLTLKFPANFVRLKKPASAQARQRRPAFIDPGPGYGDYIAVQVENYPNSGGAAYSYMATTASTVSPSNGTQTIPLYLAPGYDYVTIQEYETAPGGYLLSSQSGYLLSQGQTQGFITETANNNNLNVTMQLVMATELYNYSTTNQDFYSAAGVAVITDTYYDTTTPEFLATTYSAGQSTPMCVSPDVGSTLYFVPVDEQWGTYANSYLSGNTGNTVQGEGLPLPVVTAQSENGGSSTLITSPLGFYTPSFDANMDPIDVQVSFPNGAFVDPQPFGPFPGLTPGGSVLTQTAYANEPVYYTTLDSSDACTNVPPEPDAKARKSGEAGVRKAPPRP